MRLLLVLLLFGSAAAEPKPEAKKPKKPKVPHVKGMSEAQRGVELTPSIEYQNEVTKTPSFGGGTSLGIIKQPRWHNDMRPYSDGGMVIRPPQTGDDMNIMPGTDWLSGGPPFRRFWNVLEYGADRLFEALIPSAGST